MPKWGLGGLPPARVSELEALREREYVALRGTRELLDALRRSGAGTDVVQGFEVRFASVSATLTSFTGSRDPLLLDTPAEDAAWVSDLNEAAADRAQLSADIRQALASTTVALTWKPIVWGGAALLGIGALIYLIRRKGRR